MNPDAWPKPNTEIPKLIPAEKAEDFEAGQNIEQEFSAEQIEQIMAKVEDIDNLLADTYFHVVMNSRVNPDKYSNEYQEQHGHHFTDEEFSEMLAIDTERLHKAFKNIINNGLIGQVWGSRMDPEKNDISDVKKNYINNLRQGKTLLVHANQLPSASQMDLSSMRRGARDGVLEQKLKIAYKLSVADYVESFHKVEQFIVLFDASKFKHTNSSKPTGFKRKTEHISGEYGGSSEFGTLFSPRVSNKFFKGVVFDYVDGVLREKVSGMSAAIGSSNFTKLRNKSPKEIADEYIKIMLENTKGNTKLMVPIYDIDGNLWWPKQMSYEDVQKFIAERNIKNTSGKRNKK